jgi:hypothetical protein
MQKQHLATLIICVLLAAGLGFYGGTLYAKYKTPTGRQMPPGAAVFRGDRAGNTIGGGRAVMGGMTAGEVLSKDAQSLTVKLRDGGSKIVFYSASTTVNKMTEGSLDDVIQGSNVTINGTTNQDGSVTAQMIQLRPQGLTPDFAPPLAPAATQ